MWTQFMDMHSGGGLKEKGFSHIYIEAPEKEARVIFYNRFGHSPNRVSCTCCGEDYSVDEAETLEQASAYERGCAYVYRRPDGTECPDKEGFVPGKGIPKGYSAGYEEREGRYGLKHLTLREYLARKEILVIRAKQVSPSEREGEVPEQGYVWR